MLSEYNVGKYTKLRDAIITIHAFRDTISWKEIAFGTPGYSPDEYDSIDDRIAFEETLTAVRIVFPNTRSREYIELMEEMLDHFGRRETPNGGKQFLTYHNVCKYVARVIYYFPNTDNLEEVLKTLASLRAKHGL